MRYGDKASVLSCISVLGDVAWHAAMRARTCGHADCGTVSKVDGVGVMPDSIPTKHPQNTHNPQLTTHNRLCSSHTIHKPACSPVHLVQLDELAVSRNMHP